MDCLEAIRTRRTIRKFTRQPVEFEKVMTIVEAGTLAPSSGNIQNWRMVVVTEKDLIRDSLYNACLHQEAVQTAQVLILVCSDERVVERQYGLRGERLYGIQNTAACIENMLLAAHTIGLGACWVGAFNEDRVRSIMKIPANARPHAIIALGYPDEKPSEKRLRNLDDNITWNVYGERYKDTHRVLGDLSVEWERQIRDKKEMLQEPKENFIKACKDFMHKCKKAVMPKKKKEKEKQTKL